MQTSVTVQSEQEQLRFWQEAAGSHNSLPWAELLPWPVSGSGAGKSTLAAGWRSPTPTIRQRHHAQIRRSLSPDPNLPRHCDQINPANAHPPVPAQAQAPAQYRQRRRACNLSNSSWQTLTFGQICDAAFSFPYLPTYLPCPTSPPTHLRPGVTADGTPSENTTSTPRYPKIPHHPPLIFD